MLEKLGMQISVAEDGQQALDRLAKETFDLVLMDCQMPVLDGYAATGRSANRKKSRANTRPLSPSPPTPKATTASAAWPPAWTTTSPNPYRKEALADIVNRWLVPATKACDGSAPLIASR